MQDNITRPSKGLSQDSSFVDQPKDTYRFALNSVNETELGDFAFIGNEESNEICDSLTPDFIPLGKVYTGNNETVILSVKKDNSVSEIGILNDNCEYTVIVNDELSTENDKLHFKVDHPIDVTYRLRRGCEKTIYFTDNFNRPRYFNFGKVSNFKNDNGTWAGKLFSLSKEYSQIPEFSSVQVLDSGGVLEPGSYNIAIQYVDAGLNPTEWINTSPIIMIYNDSQSEKFLNIRGSINSDVDYLNFPVTQKSINVELDNLDESFPFYRLAFIEATSGSGLVNSVKYTGVIPTTKDFFLYTGENAETLGTEEEIAFFSEVIYRASSIEQIENRLLLGNTQGKLTNFCKLQKYASRIKADCTLRTVILNQQQDPRNPKNPTHEFGDMITGGKGYMPGELYSFGLVYVFKDGSLSPVFHIPGKSNTVPAGTVYSPGANVVPMSNVNNTSANNKYIDNDTCGSSSMWGLDSEGAVLNNAFVRHHRFPLRSEIGIPLVSEVSEGENSFDYWQLQLFAEGTVELPCTQAMIDAGECSVLANPQPFEVRVSFTVDGEPESITVPFDPNFLTNPVNEFFLSNLYSSSAIVVTQVEEGPDPNSYVTVPPGTTSPKGLTYTTSVVPSTFTSESVIYSSQILGIKFSGIEIPTLEDTNGEEIIGYYIVRNERTENEKTILDTGVLLPTLENNKYISTGLLQPESADTSKINKKVFGLIHPEHKFHNKQYTGYDYMKQEGNFRLIDRYKSKVRYNDVLDGSSYDSKSQKSGNDDGHDADGVPGSRGYDGWSLKILARDNAVTYFSKPLGFNITTPDIENKFYLNAIESRDINEGANTVYNIASDNKIGILQLKEDDIINPVVDNLPYVVMGRTISDSYANFRSLPYYKENINMGTGSTISIFNGDSYVSPMRYTNTVFWDNRVAKRAGRTSALTYIAGAILVVVGAVLAFFTAGATTIVVGAGISLIGAGALFISSGLKLDAMVKAYSEEYDKGLRETALDDWVNREYKNPNLINPDGRDGPSDDEIQWIGDCISDLWFDTTVNTALRHKMVTTLPTFLDAPGVLESGNQADEQYWEFFGLHYQKSVSRYAVSKLEYHLVNKLTTYDSSRNDNRAYLGAALGEYYEVNLDYERFNRQKIFFHLPLEYDCCSECQEDFPHRIHYSEQSFQEELTDNYRVFLPNNYRDIDGETGEVTNIFRLGGDLFIHTREALWQLPRNYQERVTDQIVSFIGTGSYFEIPPQKVLDDDTGSSAGNQHKWSAIKTPNGYFFVSENQRKIYQFTGRDLKPISSIGLSNWFKENTRLKVDEQYYNANNNLYTYRDNVSNPFGSGFISTYDTKKERILVSKKDFKFSSEVTQSGDYEICVQNGNVILFENISQTIADEEADGWDYMGIEECRLKFERDRIITTTEEREIITIESIPNTTHVYVFYDTSGSFNTGTYLADLRTSVETWYAEFRPDDIGATRLHHIDNSTEQWVDFGTIAINDPLHTGDVLVISLCNEASPVYHASTIANPVVGHPTGTYTADYNTFVGTSFPSVNSFIGINYPIATTGASYPNSKAFIQQSLLALKGDSYTPTEVSQIPVNSVFTGPEWDTVTTTLLATNPYNILGPGLDQYGWIAKVDRNDLAVVAGEQSVIITPEQFSEDINDLLEDFTTIIVTPITVVVNKLIKEYKYIDGTTVEDPIELNASWTMSYSLKQEAWISWHSYLPHFYINVPEKFYSWKYGDNNIWKHNKKGEYQTFYGELHPHIIEYISSSNPLVTKITDSFRLQTEAKRYDLDTEQYFDERFITFNKLVVYNTRQCSGEMEMFVKDTEPDQQNYLGNQVLNYGDNSMIIDRNERDWAINDFRDIRIDYSKPIWNSNINSVQSEYYIDKVLNSVTLDVNKDWTQLESFRDKYLVVRLKFDNFANIKLITNYSVENEQQSFY